MKSERERERRCERTSQHQRAREWRDRKETERESDSEHVQNGMWEYTQMVVAIHRKIRDIVRTRTNFNTPNCSECLNLWAVSVFASTRFSYFLCVIFFSFLFVLFLLCWAQHWQPTSRQSTEMEKAPKCYIRKVEFWKTKTTPKKSTEFRQNQFECEKK